MATRNGDFIRDVWRRRLHSDVWHFHGGCRWWPSGASLFNWTERETRPKSGEKCNECRAKAKRDRARVR